MRGSTIRLFAALAAIASLALAATAAAPSRTGKDAGAARAYAIQIIVPGADGGGTEEVTAPPDTVSLGGSFSFPEDGSVLSSGSATASASSSAGASVRAQASAEVDSLSLFGGEITADRVTARARASASVSTATGDTSGSAIAGLTILGQPATGGHVPLGDWGYADISSGTAVPVTARGANVFKSSTLALSIRLTAPHDGLPADTQILVAFADASARAKKVAPQQAKKPKPKSLPPPKKPPEPKSSTGSAPAQTAPRSVTPHLTPRGYVFPVFGPSSWSDDFGVPSRIASIGFHHGIDIFAPLGAPVLAVNDGVVFSVGYIPIGGNRLWVRDDQGNEFYYAHLSAFSPLAVDGRRVRAGDVLGYVGNTGDARGGPFHLHFEIHPVGLLRLGYDGVIDPAQYLSAWQHLQDVDFASGATGAAWARRLRSGSAPEPGAFLLQASDISQASGLDRSSLEHALANRRFSFPPCYEAGAGAGPPFSDCSS
jgi:murein DD-endopeptidase MepM/ murein hydrolase activator NlpD